jgi:hypothetical protein
MPTLGNTPRPAYVYDTETDTWVPVGVGAHTHSDIPNTLVDAKGDLITATADNVPARLAKGADGTVLVADSTTSTGLAWQPYGAIQVAGKNLVINGGMDFFQRGSLATTTAGYGLDRWAQVSSGSGSNVTITQQTTGVPVGSRYCARITTGASAGYGNQFHYIETSNSATLWGKTATLSIKLRRSAAFAGTLSVILAKSSTVDAGAGATWTTVGSTVVSNSLLPTGTTSGSWHTVTFTVTVPSDGSANSLRISIQQSQVETSAYWEMAQCQLEEGTAATTFSRAGGTIQGELAACQRYYESQIGNMGFVGSVGNGIAYYAFGRFQVQKRTGSSNIGITTTGVSGFPASNAIAEQINVSGFRTYLISNAATSNGFYLNNWTADCEL